VLQGERPLARDNRTLGRFRLEGIPPAPRGMPQIEVAFDIDANGILNVSAKDTASGKQQQITITASSGLSKQEVERMVREAETHASEDARRRQEIEVRNQTDGLVYATERALREHGDKLSPDERRDIEVALNDARDAVKSEDVERMRRAQDTLTRASQSLSQAASRGAGAQTGAAGQRPGSQEDEVIDAEFRDADDHRKAS
jgi:molecular chaperone DnaK